MKKLFSLGILILFVAATPIAMPAQSAGGRSTGKTADGGLGGAWRLVALEEPGPDGKVQKADCAGMFVFSDTGQVSVQVMCRNEAGSNHYSKSGYEASFGRYKVNDSHTFTFHVDGALVRTLIGKDLKRAYELEGNRLTVKSTDPNEHWRVLWERY